MFILHTIGDFSLSAIHEQKHEIYYKVADFAVCFVKKI